jgi:hypothetical protein
MKRVMGTVKNRNEPDGSLIDTDYDPLCAFDLAPCGGLNRLGPEDRKLSVSSKESPISTRVTSNVRTEWPCQELRSLTPLGRWLLRYSYNELNYYTVTTLSIYYVQHVSETETASSAPFVFSQGPL